MKIKQSETGGYNIHIDTSEKWLLFKALDVLLASNNRDSYEEKLIIEMINILREQEEE